MKWKMVRGERSENEDEKNPENEYGLLCFPSEADCLDIICRNLETHF